MQLDAHKPSVKLRCKTAPMDRFVSKLAAFCEHVCSAGGKVRFWPKKSSTPAGNINVGIIYHNLNRKNSVFALGQFNVSNWVRPVNLDRLNLMSRKATSASPSLLMVEGTRFLPKLWDTRFVMSVAHRFYNLAKLSVASDSQTGMTREENLL